MFGEVFPRLAFKIIRQNFCVTFSTKTGGWSPSEATSLGTPPLFLPFRGCRQTIALRIPTRWERIFCTVRFGVAHPKSVSKCPTYQQLSNPARSRAPSAKTDEYVLTIKWNYLGQRSAGLSGVSSAQTRSTPMPSRNARVWVWRRLPRLAGRTKRRPVKSEAEDKRD